ncbi:MAG: hypothetical protein WCJ29_02235 [bacterium]
MDSSFNKPQNLSRAELLWLGVVVVLLFVGIFGSFEPDKFRKFSPKDTVLYVSSKDNGLRSARAYLADGSTSDLSNGNGISIQKTGEISDIFVDPFPNATPWQNLRMRFSSAYGIFLNNNRTDLLFGSRENKLTYLRGSKSENLQSTDSSHLPASLTIWSTKNEPIAIMKATDREITAEAEGRYGLSTSPNVIIKTNIPNAEDFLKLLTGFDDPKKISLPLSDGTPATEIIAKTDDLIINEINSIFGKIILTKSEKLVPAILPLSDSSKDGIPTLIFSSSAFIEERSSWNEASCPITSLTSFNLNPFFALGKDQKNRITFCTK